MYGGRTYSMCRRLQIVIALSCATPSCSESPPDSPPVATIPLPASGSAPVPTANPVTRWSNNVAVGFGKSRASLARGDGRIWVSAPYSRSADNTVEHALLSQSLRVSPDEFGPAASEAMIVLDGAAHRLCRASVIDGLLGEPAACVIEDQMRVTERVVLLPMSSAGAEGASSRVELGLGVGRDGVLTDVAAVVPTGEKRFAILAERVTKVYALEWLQQAADGELTNWSKVAGLEIPSVITAARVMNHVGWVAGTGAAPPWGGDCAWWTASLSLDGKTSLVRCHPESDQKSRTIEAMDVEAAGTGCVIGWSHETSATREMHVSRLDGAHNVLWNVGIGTGFGPPAVLLRPDGRVLAAARVDGGGSSAAFFATRQISDQGVVSAWSPLPDTAADANAADTPGMPSLFTLTEGRLLVAWAADTGLHWRVLDAAGRADDDPVCDDGPQGTCRAAEPACELRSCSAQGCVATWADAGTTCGQAGACAGGVCVVP